jgi:hypothetical protein
MIIFQIGQSSSQQWLAQHFSPAMVRNCSQMKIRCEGNEIRNDGPGEYFGMLSDMSGISESPAESRFNKWLPDQKPASEKDKRTVMGTTKAARNNHLGTDETMIVPPRCGEANTVNMELSLFLLDRSGKAIILLDDVNAYAKRK